MANNFAEQARQVLGSGSFEAIEGGEYKNKGPNRMHRATGGDVYNEKAEGGESREHHKIGETIGNLLGAFGHLLPFEEGGDVMPKKRANRGMGGPSLASAAGNKVGNMNGAPRGANTNSLSEGGEPREKHGIGGMAASILGPMLGGLLPFESGGGVEDKKER